MTQPPQLDLLEKESIWHESIRAKLDGWKEDSEFDSFSKCGHESIFRVCRECGKTTELSYRCNKKWCPRCNWRISRRRAELIRAWAGTIRQPKHVVLTCQNSETITGRRIRRFQLALVKLRRQKFLAGLRGGCCSIEITNGDRGWHLHAHLLLDIRWVDAGKLARCWGKLVGQDYAIVKVLDARKHNYLAEVTKYCVKGNQLASWSADDILQFVTAIKRKRFFFVFGSLKQMREAIEDTLDFQKREKTCCECGSMEWRYRLGSEVEAEEILCETEHSRRKPASASRSSGNCTNDKAPGDSQPSLAFDSRPSSPLDSPCGDRPSSA
jgi:hypothetical protein